MDKVRKFVAFIFICFLISFFSFKLVAQEDEETTGMFLPKPIKFYAGFVLGANFTQVDGDNFAGYYKIGLNVGGIGYMKFRNHTSISWEILYSQKGSVSDQVKVSGIDSVFITKYSITTNYAEIPVMFNVYDKLKSHIGIGISYARLVNSNETLETSPKYPINFNKYSFKKDDWEFLVGAQMHLVKGLFLNLRFQYSIVPFRTDIPTNFSRAPQYHNMWTLRLIYLGM